MKLALVKTVVLITIINQCYTYPTDYYHTPVCAFYKGYYKTFASVEALMREIRVTGSYWYLIKLTPCDIIFDKCSNEKIPICSYSEVLNKFRTFINECHMNREIYNTGIVWKATFPFACPLTHKEITKQLKSNETGCTDDSNCMDREKIENTICIQREHLLSLVSPKNRTSDALDTQLSQDKKMKEIPHNNVEGIGATSTTGCTYPTERGLETTIPSFNATKGQTHSDEGNKIMNEDKKIASINESSGSEGKTARKENNASSSGYTQIRGKTYTSRGNRTMIIKNYNSVGGKEDQPTILHSSTGTERKISSTAKQNITCTNGSGCTLSVISNSERLYGTNSGHDLNGKQENRFIHTGKQTFGKISSDSISAKNPAGTGKQTLSAEPHININTSSFGKGGERERIIGTSAFILGEGKNTKGDKLTYVPGTDKTTPTGNQNFKNEERSEPKITGASISTETPAGSDRQTFSTVVQNKNINKNFSGTGEGNRFINIGGFTSGDGKSFDRDRFIDVPGTAKITHTETQKFMNEKSNEPKITDDSINTESPTGSGTQMSSNEEQNKNLNTDFSGTGEPDNKFINIGGFTSGDDKNIERDRFRYVPETDKTIHTNQQTFKNEDSKTKITGDSKDIETPVDSGKQILSTVEQNRDLNRDFSGTGEKGNGFKNISGFILEDGKNIERDRFRYVPGTDKTIHTLKQTFKNEDSKTKNTSDSKSIETPVDSGKQMLSTVEQNRSPASIAGANKQLSSTNEIYRNIDESSEDSASIANTTPSTDITGRKVSMNLNNNTITRESNRHRNPSDGSTRAKSVASSTYKDDKPSTTGDSNNLQHSIVTTERNTLINTETLFNRDTNTIKNSDSSDMFTSSDVQMYTTQESNTSTSIDGEEKNGEFSTSTERQVIQERDEPSTTDNATEIGGPTSRTKNTTAAIHNDSHTSTEGLTSTVDEGEEHTRNISFIGTTSASSKDSKPGPEKQTVNIKESHSNTNIEDSATLADRVSTIGWEITKTNIDGQKVTAKETDTNSNKKNSTKAIGIGTENNEQPTIISGLTTISGITDTSPTATSSESNRITNIDEGKNIFYTKEISSSTNNNISANTDVPFNSNVQIFTTQDTGLSNSENQKSFAAENRNKSINKGTDQLEGGSTSGSRNIFDTSLSPEQAYITGSIFVEGQTILIERDGTTTTAKTQHTSQSSASVKNEVDTTTSIPYFSHTPDLLPTTAEDTPAISKVVNTINTSVTGENVVSSTDIGGLVTSKAELTLSTHKQSSGNSGSSFTEEESTPTTGGHLGVKQTLAPNEHSRKTADHSPVSITLSPFTELEISPAEESDRKLNAGASLNTSGSLDLTKQTQTKKGERNMPTDKVGHISTNKESDRSQLTVDSIETQSRILPTGHNSQVMTITEDNRAVITNESLFTGEQLVVPSEDDRNPSIGSLKSMEEEVFMAGENASIIQHNDKQESLPDFTNFDVHSGANINELTTLETNSNKIGDITASTSPSKANAFVAVKDLNKLLGEVGESSTTEVSDRLKYSGSSTKLSGELPSTKAREKLVTDSDNFAERTTTAKVDTITKNTMDTSVPREKNQQASTVMDWQMFTTETDQMTNGNGLTFKEMRIPTIQEADKKDIFNGTTTAESLKTTVNPNFSPEKMSTLEEDEPQISIINKTDRAMNIAVDMVSTNGGDRTTTLTPEEFDRIDLFTGIDEQISNNRDLREGNRSTISDEERRINTNDDAGRKFAGSITQLMDQTHITKESDEITTPSIEDNDRSITTFNFTNTNIFSGGDHEAENGEGRSTSFSVIEGGQTSFTKEDENTINRNFMSTQEPAPIAHKEDVSTRIDSTTRTSFTVTIEERTSADKIAGFDDFTVFTTRVPAVVGGITIKDENKNRSSGRDFGSNNIGEENTTEEYGAITSSRSDQSSATIQTTVRSTNTDFPIKSSTLKENEINTSHHTSTHRVEQQIPNKAQTSRNGKRNKSTSNTAITNIEVITFTTEEGEVSTISDNNFEMNNSRRTDKQVVSSEQENRATITTTEGARTTVVNNRNSMNEQMSMITKSAHTTTDIATEENEANDKSKSITNITLSILTTHKQEQVQNIINDARITTTESMIASGGFASTERPVLQNNKTLTTDEERISLPTADTDSNIATEVSTGTDVFNGMEQIRNLQETEKHNTTNGFTAAIELHSSAKQKLTTEGQVSTVETDDRTTVMDDSNQLANEPNEDWQKHIEGTHEEGRKASGSDATSATTQSLKDMNTDTQFSGIGELTHTTENDVRTTSTLNFSSSKNKQNLNKTKSSDTTEADGTAIRRDFTTAADQTYTMEENDKGASFGDFSATEQQTSFFQKGFKNVDKKTFLRDQMRFFEEDKTTTLAISSTTEKVVSSTNKAGRDTFIVDLSRSVGAISSTEADALISTSNTQQTKPNTKSSASEEIGRTSTGNFSDTNLVTSTNEADHMIRSTVKERKISTEGEETTKPTFIEGETKESVGGSTSLIDSTSERLSIFNKNDETGLSPTPSEEHTFIFEAGRVTTSFRSTDTLEQMSTEKEAEQISNRSTGIDDVTVPATTTLAANAKSNEERTSSGFTPGEAQTVTIEKINQDTSTGSFKTTIDFTNTKQEVSTPRGDKVATTNEIRQKIPISQTTKNINKWSSTTITDSTSAAISFTTEGKQHFTEEARDISADKEGLDSTNQMGDRITIESGFTEIMAEIYSTQESNIAESSSNEITTKKDEEDGQVPSIVKDDKAAISDASTTAFESFAATGFLTRKNGGTFTTESAVRSITKADYITSMEIYSTVGKTSNIQMDKITSMIELEQTSTTEVGDISEIIRDSEEGKSSISEKLLNSEIHRIKATGDERQRSTNVETYNTTEAISTSAESTTATSDNAQTFSTKEDNKSSSTHYSITSIISTELQEGRSTKNGGNANNVLKDKSDENTATVNMRSSFEEDKNKIGFSTDFAEEQTIITTENGRIKSMASSSIPEGDGNAIGDGFTKQTFAGTEDIKYSANAVSKLLTTAEETTTTETILPATSEHVSMAKDTDGNNDSGSSILFTSTEPNSRGVQLPIIQKNVMTTTASFSTNISGSIDTVEYVPTTKANDIVTKAERDETTNSRDNNTRTSADNSTYDIILTSTTRVVSTNEEDRTLTGEKREPITTENLSEPTTFETSSRVGMHKTNVNESERNAITSDFENASKEMQSSASKISDSTNSIDNFSERIEQTTTPSKFVNTEARVLKFTNDDGKTTTFVDFAGTTISSHSQRQVENDKTAIEKGFSDKEITNENDEAGMNNNSEVKTATTTVFSFSTDIKIPIDKETDGIRDASSSTETTTKENRAKNIKNSPHNDGEIFTTKPSENLEISGVTVSTREISSTKGNADNADIVIHGDTTVSTISGIDAQAETNDENERNINTEIPTSSIVEDSDGDKENTIGSSTSSSSSTISQESGSAAQIEEEKTSTLGKLDRNENRGDFVNTVSIDVMLFKSTTQENYNNGSSSDSINAMDFSVTGEPAEISEKKTTAASIFAGDRTTSSAKNDASTTNSSKTEIISEEFSSTLGPLSTMKEDISTTTEISTDKSGRYSTGEKISRNTDAGIWTVSSTEFTYEAYDRHANTGDSSSTSGFLVTDEKEFPAERHKFIATSEKEHLSTTEESEKIVSANGSKSTSVHGFIDENNDSSGHRNAAKDKEVSISPTDDSDEKNFTSDSIEMWTKTSSTTQDGKNNDVKAQPLTSNEITDSSTNTETSPFIFNKGDISASTEENNGSRNSIRFIATTDSRGTNEQAFNSNEDERSKIITSSTVADKSTVIKKLTTAEVSTFSEQTSTEKDISTVIVSSSSPEGDVSAKTLDQLFTTEKEIIVSTETSVIKSQKPSLNREHEENTSTNGWTIIDKEEKISSNEESSRSTQTVDFKDSTSTESKELITELHRPTTTREEFDILSRDRDITTNSKSSVSSSNITRQTSAPTKASININKNGSISSKAQLSTTHVEVLTATTEKGNENMSTVNLVGSDNPSGADAEIFFSTDSDRFNNMGSLNVARDNITIRDDEAPSSSTSSGVLALTGTTEGTTTTNQFTATIGSEKGTTSRGRTVSEGLTQTATGHTRMTNGVIMVTEEKLPTLEQGDSNINTSGSADVSRSTTAEETPITELGKISSIANYVSTRGQSFITESNAPATEMIPADSNKQTTLIMEQKRNKTEGISTTTQAHAFTNGAEEIFTFETNLTNGLDQEDNAKQKNENTSIFKNTKNDSIPSTEDLTSEKSWEITSTDGFDVTAGYTQTTKRDTILMTDSTNDKDDRLIPSEVFDITPEENSFKNTVNSKDKGQLISSTNLSDRSTDEPKSIGDLADTRKHMSEDKFAINTHSTRVETYTTIPDDKVTNIDDSVDISESTYINTGTTEEVSSRLMITSESSDIRSVTNNEKISTTANPSSSTATASQTLFTTGHRSTRTPNNNGSAKPTSMIEDIDSSTSKDTFTTTEGQITSIRENIITTPIANQRNQASDEKQNKSNITEISSEMGEEAFSSNKPTAKISIKDQEDENKIESIKDSRVTSVSNGANDTKTSSTTENDRYISTQNTTGSLRVTVVPANTKAHLPTSDERGTIISSTDSPSSTLKAEDVEGKTFATKVLKSTNGTTTINREGQKLIAEEDDRNTGTSSVLSTSTTAHTLSDEEDTRAEIINYFSDEEGRKTTIYDLSSDIEEQKTILPRNNTNLGFIGTIEKIPNSEEGNRSKDGFFSAEGLQYATTKISPNKGEQLFSNEIINNFNDSPKTRQQVFNNKLDGLNKDAKNLTGAMGKVFTDNKDKTTYALLSATTEGQISTSDSTETKGKGSTALAVGNSTVASDLPETINKSTIMDGITDVHEYIFSTEESKSFTDNFNDIEVQTSITEGRKTKSVSSSTVIENTDRTTITSTYTNIPGQTLFDEEDNTILSGKGFSTMEKGDKAANTAGNTETAKQAKVDLKAISTGVSDSNRILKPILYTNGDRTTNIGSSTFADGSKAIPEEGEAVTKMSISTDADIQASTENKNRIRDTTETTAGVSSVTEEQILTTKEDDRAIHILSTTLEGKYPATEKDSPKNAGKANSAVKQILFNKNGEGVTKSRGSTNTMKPTTSSTPGKNIGDLGAGTGDGEKSRLVQSFKGIKAQTPSIKEGDINTKNEDKTKHTGGTDSELSITKGDKFTGLDCRERHNVPTTGEESINTSTTEGKNSTTNKKITINDDAVAVGTKISNTTCSSKTANDCSKCINGTTNPCCGVVHNSQNNVYNGPYAEGDIYHQPVHNYYNMVPISKSNTSSDVYYGFFALPVNASSVFELLKNFFAKVTSNLSSSNTN